MNIENFGFSQKLRKNSECDYIYVSRFSKILIDINGNIVYEDYSKLEEYIDNVIIKNHANYKRIIIDDIENYECSVSLSFLTSCYFSELEFQYVMKYLEDRCIIVKGFDSTFENEFDNYKFLGTCKNESLPVNISFEEQKKKFAMIKDESLSENIKNKVRNELIETNLRLVPYVSYKYSILNNIDILELNSYGYEGLIRAVFNFDVDRGNSFSNYAVFCIRGAIVKGIIDILGFSCQKKLFSTYIEIKNIIESETGKKVQDDSKLIYIIVSEMKKKLDLDEKTCNCLLSSLFINNCESLECIQEFETEEDIEDIVFFNDLSRLVNDGLKELSEREADVLKYRYGFFDGKLYTLREIGEMLDLSYERVRQIELSAKKNLKFHMKVKKMGK